MKKSFIMSTAIAMMFMAMLFLANGCAKPSHPAGAEWYSAVPKAEHERRFPHGHQRIPGLHGENCVYNEKTGTYFRQFDWFE